MASAYELEPWSVTDVHGPEAESLVPLVAYDELHANLLAEEHDIPFMVQGDLHLWMGQLGGNNAHGEYTKVGEPQRYPQSWVEAGLTIHSNGRKWENWEKSSALYDQHQTYPNPPSQDVERQRWNALMATQRALFMTPSIQSTAFPVLPGSPISDPCGTPETSSASLEGRWEPDQESEDMQSSRSPEPSHPHPSWSDHFTYSHPSHPFAEEEYPTTLEMPDGSTRRTSNWLPVDASAGFTIGADHLDPTQRDHGLHDFREMQGAFIQAKPASWTYNQ